MMIREFQERNYRLVLLLVAAFGAGLLTSRPSTRVIGCTKVALSDSTQEAKNRVHINEESRIEFKEGIPDNKETPQIALLMTFPNSGTTYTLKMIQDLTLLRTASNYQHEFTGMGPIPVFEDQPGGPFWPERVLDEVEKMHPRQYILTKTHCGSYCGANHFLTSASCSSTMYSFRDSCLTCQGGHGQHFYSPDRVRKAVRLFRDPFDNVVARFHFEWKHTTNPKYDKTPDGFREYCKSLRNKVSSKDLKLVFHGIPALEDMVDVPCFVDFFRYVEWHNLAFAMTSGLGLDTHIVHYDWYESRFNETVTELLDFLHMEPRGEIAPFITGKKYRDYFTKAERQKVNRALKHMASPDTWEQIKVYLTG